MVNIVDILRVRLNAEVHKGSLKFQQLHVFQLRAFDDFVSILFEELEDVGLVLELLDFTRLLLLSKLRKFFHQRNEDGLDVEICI